jgi:hypothetical protein
VWNPQILSGGSGAAQTAHYECEMPKA